MGRLIAVLAALAALAGCKHDGKAGAAAAPRPVVSVVVSPSAGLAASYAGTIAARVETPLAFPLAGTMVARPVHEGDSLKKGALLARLDVQSLDAQVRAAEAGVTVAQAQLKSARDAADRTNALLGRGVDSPAAAEAAANSLAAARARLAQAGAALAQAQDMRRLAVLRAPMDGVVTAVYAQPGAAVKAGQPVLRLAGTDQREAVIDMTDRDAAGLERGASFRVRLEADRQIRTTARLRLIDPVSDRATRTRRLHLTLAADAAPAFRLGALVLVEPDAATHARITLPETALIGGEAVVWVIAPKTRKLERRAVTLGAQQGGRVVVLKGLASGEEVMTKGVNSVKQGQTVGPRVPA